MRSAEFQSGFNRLKFPAVFHNLKLPVKQIFGWIRKLAKVVILSSVPLCGSAAAESPDYEREERLAQEAIAGLFDGEVVYLNDGSREFLSLFSVADDANLNAAFILLHGRGFHPDWPQVVGPLREKFTDEGLTTLALQMPVLEKGAKYYQYLDILPLSFPRIEAGIQFLQSKGFDWIGVIAHSCSVHMSMAWIQARGDGAIDAYVGIGMEATDYKQPMLEPFPLEDMTVPILDVYGSEDYPAVIKGAVNRKIAIEIAGNAGSQTIEIPGADHFFEDYEDDLGDAIIAWLKSILS